MPSRPQSAAANVPAAPPSAPPAPPGPPKAPVIQLSSAPADRGMLLGEIQSGRRLRKTQTNDRSTSALAGKVIGSDPPPAGNGSQADLEQKRRSVDWIGGMAADGMRQLAPNHQPNLQSHAEEPTQKATETLSEENHREDDDFTNKFDMSRSIRVRSLYAYEAQRKEDLTMAENLVIVAHPSKLDDDWLYGTIEATGKAGAFPKNYAEEIFVKWGKALYDYPASSLDEVSMVENDRVAVVDRSDPDWFRVEHEGRIGLVPGAYVELEEDS